MAEQDTPPPTITAMKIPLIKKEPTPTGEQASPSAHPALKTAKQLAAKRNQERVKSILLLAIPDEYLLKFHNVPNAKSLREAIKSRFGGNEESKKMQKNVLKHQFENFTTAPYESLDKAYDRFQKLISQMEVYGTYMSKEDINQKFLRSLPPAWNQIALIMRNKSDIDQVDIDDLYNNLRVYEDKMKSSSSSSSTSKNLAFLSSENTSSTNKVSSVSGEFGVNTAGGTNQASSTPLMEMTWKNWILDGRSGRNQERRTNGDNGRSNAPTNESSSQALNFDNEREKHSKARLEIHGYELALESLEARILGHERNELAWGESQISARDKTGLGYDTQLNELSSNSKTDSEISLSVFDVRSSDAENTPENDKLSKDGFHAIPPPITRNFLTLRHDISFAGLDEFAIRNKIIESTTTESKTNETVGKTNKVNTTKPKYVCELVVSNPRFNKEKVIIEDWTSDDEDEGIRFKKVKACFVCKSTDHLIKDCHFHDKISQEPKKKNVVITGQRVDKPVWDNTKRVNHQNFLDNLKYPHLRETFVPSGVLTRTGLVHTAKPVSTARPSVSTAKPVNTARPISTARPFGNPEIFIHDQAVVDSGCSSHMTGNKAYLSDYEDYNGGFVAFGSDPKGGKITGRGKIKTANLDFDDVYFVDELKFNLFFVSQMCDKKNSVLFTETECLILSLSFKLFDESQVVLRAPRKDDVYILDLKNIIPSRDSINKKRYCLVVTDDFSRFSWVFFLATKDETSEILYSLGKFDGKSDEGYLLGYSTTSKAFRVYNKRTKRVKENMHIDFLDHQPNVAGTIPNWMFDLDFLTNTMNYIPVSVENQVHVDAVEAIVQDAQVKPSKNVSKDKNV
ncbi:hypothetical protein Tco_1090133 [Tanacetum coccineum]|uniref:Uncharacterized protein n=1 Tax=Tanacetum coccineum TaxID=301880 RepID=A0ABQ5I3E3_9ASTR